MTDAQKTMDWLTVINSEWEGSRARYAYDIPDGVADVMNALPLLLRCLRACEESRENHKAAYARQRVIHDASSCRQLTCAALRDDLSTQLKVGC